MEKTVLIAALFFGIFGCFIIKNAFETLNEGYFIADAIAKFACGGIFVVFTLVMIYAGIRIMREDL